MGDPARPIVTRRTGRGLKAGEVASLDWALNIALAAAGPSIRWRLEEAVMIACDPSSEAAAVPGPSSPRYHQGECGRPRSCRALAARTGAFPGMGSTPPT